MGTTNRCGIHGVAHDGKERRRNDRRRFVITEPRAGLAVLVGTLAMLLAACGPSADDGGGQTSGADGDSAAESAISLDERAMAAEERPDFSSPQVVDEQLVVEGAPEELTWYTSSPGVFGSPRAKQGGTYRMNWPEFPPTFRTLGPNANNVFAAYTRSPIALVGMNYQTREWIPALATHWAFGSDGKTAYYKLNENARWSDGEQVTAADFLFMMDMMRSENIQDPWYNVFYSEQIVDLRAYGDYLIAVESDAPAAPNDLLFNTNVAPRPEHFYAGEIPEDYVERYQWEFEPTPGPYTLESYVTGESITFAKVEDWWGHEYDYNRYRYNFDHLEWRVITGGQDIVREYFGQGEIDFNYQIIPQEWEMGASQEAYLSGYVDRYSAYYVPTQGLTGIFLNTQFPVFSDDKVRRGLYYAINIQRMIDTVLRGDYARYHNIGIGHELAGVLYDDDEIRKPDFDPERAAELFAAGGFHEVGTDGIRVNDAGTRLAFDLIYAAPHHTERLAVLKEEATKAGLEINLQLMTTGSFTALREKNFQAYWGSMTTSIVPDYWEYFHSDNADEPQNNNFFGYGSPVLDELLDAARAEGDARRKAELTKQVQRYIHDAALVIPSYYVPYFRAGVWKWIRFPAWLNQRYAENYFDPLSDDVGYAGFMWFDEEIQQEVLQAMQRGDTFPSREYIVDTYRAD